MITVRGKIENGKVLALEPIDEEFEGREVAITIEVESVREPNGNKEDVSGKQIRADWERFMQTIRENEIETEMTDMAHQHDHYIYGTPKRED
jgi:hypothetical protein